MREKLRKLLKFREIFEKERKRELELVRSLKKQKELELSELLFKIKNESFLENETTAFSLSLFSDYIWFLFSKKREIEQEIKKIEEEEKRKLELYIEAKQEKEIAQKLSERFERREFLERMKREEKFYDEIVLLKKGGGRK